MSIIGSLNTVFTAIGFCHTSYVENGPGVVWWLRHRATSQRVPGSIPGGVTGDFFCGSP